MNRPKLPKNAVRDFFYAELDEYCDELEKQLKFINEYQTPSYEKTQKDLWDCQKSLDRAIYLLAKSDDCVLHYKDITCPKDCGECWRKYLDE